MNVSSSTSTSSTQNAGATAGSSSAVKTQDKNQTSFQEEMKNVDNAEIKEQGADKNSDKVEAKTQEENKTSGEHSGQQNKQASEKTILNAKIDVNPDVDAKLNTTDILSLNIQQLLDTQNQINGKIEPFRVTISTSEDLTKNIGQTLDFANVEMNEGDAQFFVDIVKNNNAGVQNVVQDIQQAMEFGTEEVQKSANVSKTLINALHNSAKTGQSVRIDFGNDVAVVMRVGKDGAIMANFIPGDKAVEEYLKNNIAFLKQRFEEEDIPYSQLSYSQNQQQRRQQQENNKENRHE